MAADLDFTGIIRKDNFLKLADAHFDDPGFAQRRLPHPSRPAA